MSGMAELVGRPGRAAELRRRHRDYYEALAAEADAQSRLPEHVEWRRTLDDELENLRLALEWSLVHDEVDEALRLAIAVHDISQWRGDDGAGREWMDRALALAGDRVSSLRAQALLTRCGPMAQEVRPVKAETAHAALEVARQAGDERLVARILCLLGSRHLASAVGGPDQSRAFMEESLAIARALDDDLLIADALHDGWWLETEPLQSIAQRQEALGLYRKAGDRSATAWALYGFGWIDLPDTQAAADKALAMARELDEPFLLFCAFEMVACRRTFVGDYDGALAVIEEALVHIRGSGHRWPLVWAEDWMIRTQIRFEADRGDVESAQHHAQSYVVTAERRDARIELAWGNASLGLVAAAGGDPERGVALCEESVATARQVGWLSQLSFTLYTLGRVLYAAGDRSRARAVLEEASSRVDLGPEIDGSVTASAWLLADLHVDAGDAIAAETTLASVRGQLYRCRINEPVSQLHLARVARVRGELASAHALYAAALTRLQEIGHRPYMALVLEDVAALAVEQGAPERAATLYGAAERLREDCGFAVPIEERPRHEEWVTILRSVADVADAWAAGRELSLEDAMAAALDDPDGSSQAPTP